MEEQNGALWTQIRLDVSKLKKDVADAEKAYSGMTNSIKKDSNELENIWSGMAGKIAGAFTFAAAAEFTKKVASVRGEMQQLEIAYKTMLGSATKGNQLLAESIELAAKTPFGLQDVAAGSKMLLAYGSNAEEVSKELTMLGDIAAGLSMPLNDLVYLYGTTRTQGRLFTQDLRQFMGRGIPITEELAKQFGVTKDKVGDLVTAGKVGFEDVRKALVAMTSEGGKFGGLMEEQSKSITGQISNLEDSVYQMFNEIGKASEGAISTTISGVSYIVENYKKIGAILADVVVAYGSYKAAVIATSAMQKVAAATTSGWTVAQLAQYKALLLLEKAQKKFNAAALKNPYVLAGAAVASLTFGIYKLITAETKAEKAARENAEVQAKIKEQYKERGEAAKELVQIVNDETKSERERAKALDELHQMAPQYIDDLKSQAEGIKGVRIEQSKLNLEMSKHDQETLTKQQEHLIAIRKKLKDTETFEHSIKSVDLSVLTDEDKKWLEWGGIDMKKLNAMTALNKITDKIEEKRNKLVALVDVIGQNMQNVREETERAESEAAEKGLNLTETIDAIVSNEKELKNAQAEFSKTGTKGDEEKVKNLETELKDLTDRYKTMTGKTWGAKDPSEKIKNRYAEMVAELKKAIEDTEREIASMSADGIINEYERKLQKINAEFEKANADAVFEYEQAIRDIDEKLGKGELDKKQAEDLKKRQETLRDDKLALSKKKKDIDDEKAAREQYIKVLDKQIAKLAKIGKLTRDQALAEIESLKEKLKDAKTDDEKEKIQAAIESAQEAQKEYDSYKEGATWLDRIKNLKDEIAKAQDKIANGVKLTNEEEKELAENMAEFDAEILSAASAAVQFAQEIGDALAQFDGPNAGKAKDFMRSFGELAGNMGGTVSQLAQGNVAGGVISFVASSINMLARSVKDSKQRIEDQKQSLADYKMQLYEIGIELANVQEKNAGLFGNTELQNVQIAADHYKNLAGQLRDLKLQYVSYSKDKKGDVRTILNDSNAYSYYVNEDGTLNREKMAELQREIDKKSGDVKMKAEQTMAMLHSFEEAYEQVEEYISGLFDNTATSIADDLLDAFMAGTDGVHAFEKSVEQSMNEVKKSIFKNMVIGEIFDAIEPLVEKYKEAYISTDAEQIAAAEAALTAGLEGTNIPEWAKKLFDALQISGGETDVASYTKGIAQASQDSIDELNGRLTAIQGHTFGLNENVRMLREMGGALLADISAIKSNTAELHRMRQDINEIAQRASTTGIKVDQI